MYGMCMVFYILCILVYIGVHYVFIQQINILKMEECILIMNKQTPDIPILQNIINPMY